MDDESRHVARQRLNAFVGTWELEAVFPSNPTETLRGGRSVFEWMKEQNVLVQRTEAPGPVPDSISIVALDADTDRYVQHYFDSRGVVRLYAMSLQGEVWTLSRTTPDFSPLDFSQRYTGTFSEDGKTIRGAWETSTDGQQWEKDFDLSYVRVA